jgi:acyl-homoserine lactone acylase PvdQ
MLYHLYAQLKNAYLQSRDHREIAEFINADYRGEGLFRKIGKLEN